MGLRHGRVFALTVALSGSALLLGHTVPARMISVDVESGPCVTNRSRVELSRDERGYRLDIVAPADGSGEVPVVARLRRGVLRVWVTRTGDATCQRVLVVRPRLVSEPIRGVVVETRDGIAARMGHER